MTKKHKTIVLGVILALLAGVALYLNLRDGQTVDPKLADDSIKASQKSLEESPPPPEPPPVARKSSYGRQ